MVQVPLWVWLLTLAAIVLLLLLDLVRINRNPHEVRMREAAGWVAFYVACALLFAVGIAAVWTRHRAGEFLAGYITEYSLSADNLFVFLIIMTSFAVPAIYVQKVLTVGILIAIAMRGVFIALGAAALEAFAFTFYLFGAFLLFTAIQLLRGREEDPDPEHANPVVRAVERFLPTTREYHGSRLSIRVDGKRMITPMALVMISIGTTDLLFALDSIPAIFGLTNNAYIVFTANAFALLGLRQMYFLLNGLLDRLVFLNYGLAVILAFIGVKLILHAVHKNSEGAPEIGIATSLLVIVTVLSVTVIASLWHTSRHPEDVVRVTAGPPVDRPTGADGATHAAPADSTAPAGTSAPAGSTTPAGISAPAGITPRTTHAAGTAAATTPSAAPAGSADTDDSGRPERRPVVEALPEPPMSAGNGAQRDGSRTTLP